jgi:hypothetical protein
MMEKELDFQRCQFDTTFIGVKHQGNKVLPAAYWQRWGKDMSVEQLVRVRSERVLRDILEMAKGADA